MLGGKGVNMSEIRVSKFQLGDSGRKVLWFSRHTMTAEQLSALGTVREIVQCDGTISSAWELADEINDCDIIAIVAPIGLQQQFLKLAGDKPVVMALSERVITPDPEGGESKVDFVFQKWERLLRIEVEKEDFDPLTLD